MGERVQYLPHTLTRLPPLPAMTPCPTLPCLMTWATTHAVDSHGRRMIALDRIAVFDAGEYKDRLCPVCHTHSLHGG